MTTLVLQAADSLIGAGASAATSLLGGAVSGLLSGGGAGDSVRTTSGPRLTEMPGLASTEGAPIPRLYGRARVGGQLIWATRFEEVVTTATTSERQPSRGGKGFGARAATASTTSTTYSYHANLAVGLCEGPIAFVRRVWADARELDLTTLNVRFYPGNEVQAPDPLIVAKEGAENAPAYRGLAYAVFERLPLAAFGNRVPQLSFEVVRGVDGLRQMIRSVCLIPGATEFGYDTRPVTQSLGLGASRPENIHQLGHGTDIGASLAHLEALCPNLTGVSLVVSWFGGDLRAGQCRVLPKVDLVGKATVGTEWRVAGLSRAEAEPTSRVGDHAAYGGTPSDESVVRLIGELKARGLRVTLYPFVMMDIPAGNALPDPRSGEAGQPPYPWRGRITCDPAPGRPGSADATTEAAAQVAAFFGAASPSAFGIAGGAVTYAGPPEWSFRRLVLHYAELAVLAGGVDAFIIGSELVGLTRIRSAPGAYPAVAQLRALAADVRAMLGPATKITYAADWTEYGAHVLDGGAEVRFPLDPLWADPAIDAVGIDWYPPLSDWRDAPAHADEPLARSLYDVGYLRDRLGAGEAFDWYYPDEAARSGQARLPITDGAYGKPWLFRAKDLAGWWSNPHVERVGSVETAATGWVPGSKPIWLTEIGIPAVDKGPNGPNVFPDPKSSESAAPPLSTGLRDDLVQIRGLEALLSRFDPALPGHRPGDNPASGPIRMVDPERVSVWCWDARPYPAFPDFSSVWADGPNWTNGHWITGRIEGAPLDRLVAAILADLGLPPPAAIPLDGFVDGYVLDRPMSARDALEPLGTLFGFDAVASGGAVTWRGRGGTVQRTLLQGELATQGDEPLLSRVRAQETELPAAIELGFVDCEGEYGRASAGSRRLAGGSRRELSTEVAIVTRRAEAERLAGIRLQGIWAARETLELRLSPREIALEPGDVIAMSLEPGRPLYRVTRIADGAVRGVTARSVEPAMFRPGLGATGAVRPRSAPPRSGPVHAVILDLPASGTQPVPLQYLAATADPWPGAVAVWRSAEAGSFALHRVLALPAIVGRTSTALPAGPVWRFDRVSRLDVTLSRGSLASVGREAALGGRNLFAILGPDGTAELVSAAEAELIGERTYRLSDLLRGLGGTEEQAGRHLPAGCTLVVLDEAVEPLATSLAELGAPWTYRVAPADRDPADPIAIQFASTAGTTALRPLAPVHPRLRRRPEGVAIDWIRRTRLDGDGWDLAEVPLGEEDERYELDVLKDGLPVRTLATSTTSALYGAAQELADFGVPQAQLSVRVAQMSRVVGRGRSLSATVPII